MADTSNIPSFQKAIDIISDALCIIDFSYLISGSMSYAILRLIFSECNFNSLIISDEKWVQVFFSVISIYVLGILCGAIGFHLRKFLGWTLGLMSSIMEGNKKNDNDGNNSSDKFFVKRFIAWIKEKPMNLLKRIKEKTKNLLDWIIEKIYPQQSEIIKKTKLEPNSESDKAKTEDKAEDNEYIFMWCKLSTNSNAKERMSFINRFWVMQKVYEGLMTNCLLAFTYVFVNDNINMRVGFPIILVAFIVFLREAGKNYETQVKEVFIAYQTYCLNSSSKGTNKQTGKE